MPELIDKEMVLYQGGSISIKLFDPNIYELASDNQYEITFFKTELVKGEYQYTKVAGSTSEGLSYDDATGSIIYTFNTALDYDTVVILYRFRKKSGTRGDSGGITVGSVRAVVVTDPLLEMLSAEELSVDVKSTEPGANSCILEYSLAFPDSAPKGRVIDAEHKLELLATMNIPAGFGVTLADGEEVPTSRGDSVTFKYQASCFRLSTQATRSPFSSAQRHT